MPGVDNLQHQSPQKYQPPSHVSTSFKWSQPWGSHICIAGSFDPPIPVWTPIDMSKNADNINEVILDLTPNKKYFYKFVIDNNWVLDQDTPSYPDESGNYNHVIEVKPPPPPPLPSEEEIMTVESQQYEEEQKVENIENQQDEEPKVENHDQKEMTVESQQDEEPKVENFDQKETITVESQQDEEQKVENLESEVLQKEHNHENQIVDEEQEQHQNVEEQVEPDIQKEQHQHEENQNQLHQEEEQHEDNQVVTNDQKEYNDQKEEEQVLSEAQIEQNQHEENQVGTNDQKEHYQHNDDQKEQYLHEVDRIVHKHEEDQVMSESQEKTDQIVKEVHTESTVIGETVQTEQSRDNSVITEVSVTPDTAPVSIVKETIIEPDNEMLSAEHVANNESIIENTSDIIINEETSKESQYTSSTPHDDSMSPVTTIEKEINITGEVTSEQTKEEMTSINHDEGISSITTITQGKTDSEISDVNVEGLNNEVKAHEDIIEHSDVVEDYSTNESKVTEFIEEKHEQNITTKDISLPSSVRTSDSTTNAEEFDTHSTDTIMPSTDMNYEETYQPELGSINENVDDNYKDDNYEDDNYEDYNYEDDDYEDDNYYNKDDNKDDNNNEYSNYEELLKGEIYPGVSQEAIKEVILNHTWAKDESMDDTIPSTWTEPFESSAYVWTENTQAEWSDKEQVISALTLGEENTGTPKSEFKSHETPSTILVGETVTEQTTSTIVNENLESTIIPVQSTIYNNESNIEHKTQEIIRENIEKEYDNMTGVIKENTISTSEVKVVAEPSSVQYEKPESSATAYEKVSSIPTTVIANEQDTINADVLKAIEKLKLVEKQGNSEESLGKNISAGMINQHKIPPISPNASSPGESTRNADMYNHNKTVAITTSQIASPTNIKSRSKKPPREITSREVLQRDPIFVTQRDDLVKLDFNVVYLVTSVATTFALGIISMLYKSVFGSKKTK